MRSVELTSRQLRTLAHPLRFRLLGALRLDGPATATALARRLGTNSGQTSYHLRRLADAGLVAEVEGRGRGRERWWRAEHDLTVWSPSAFRTDPDDRAASDWIEHRLLDVQDRWRQRWHATRDEAPPEWLAAADQSDWSLRLTPERLATLVDEVAAVVGRFVADPDDDPEAEVVTVLFQAFPNPDPVGDLGPGDDAAAR